MSFVNPIQGYIPNSEFIYTTTNVNADNVTCTDLIATNGNFTNLTTTTFSPVNIDGTNLTCDSATINDLTANTITASDGYITTIINDISFITLANILTATIDDAIIKNIDCSDIFIKDKTNLLSKTRIYRDGNSTYFIGRGVAGQDKSNFVFITGTTGAALTIRDDNITEIASVQSPYVECENILIDNTVTTNNLQSNTITNTGLITSGTITADISSNLVAGTGINLNTVGGITTITNTGIVTDPLTVNQLNSNFIFNTNSITTNSIYGDLVETKYIKIQDETTADNSFIRRQSSVLKIASDTSTPIELYFNAGSLPVCRVENSKFHINGIMNTTGTITCPQIVSTGTATLQNLDVTTNIDTATLNCPAITAGEINATTTYTNSLISTNINTNTITSSGTATLQDLNVTTNIGCNFLASASIDCSVFNASTITSNTINTPTITTTDISFTGGIVGPFDSYLICESVAVKDIVGQDLEINGPSRLNGTATIETSITSPLATITNINTTNLTANTVTGNISSNLASGTGISLSTVAGITTIEATGGIATSTQYAFQVTSNLNNNQVISTGVPAIFDVIELCVPSTSAYNTASYRYTCPVGGIYSFGFKGFINTITDNFRMAIFKNGGDLLGMGGAGSEASEAFDIIEQMAAGDEVYISCITGSANIYMAAKHSWWYGHLLQPTNNSVETTTDLTVQSLTGDISANLTASYGIELSTTLGITSITTNPSYFCANLTTNYAPGSDTQYILIYDTVPYVPLGFSYNYSTGVLTVNNAGTYEISASANMDIVLIPDRVTLRARLRINGVWTFGLPQGYAYMRHQNYGMYGTSTISPIIQILNAGDTIDITCNVNKGSTTIFNSDFSGLQFFNGCNILVKRLH